MWAHVLHCALENGADLYVKDRQKTRHYRARSVEERKRRQECKWCLRKIALYSDVLHSFDWKSAQFTSVVLFPIIIGQ